MPQMSDSKSQTTICAPAWAHRLLWAGLLFGGFLIGYGIRGIHL
jgi:hypothetical protein